MKKLVDEEGKGVARRTWTYVLSYLCKQSTQHITYGVSIIIPKINVRRFTQREVAAGLLSP
jgi:hypothetical protein